MPPRSSQDVDEEGFTKVSTIRYKTPVAPAKPKKHRKGRGKPAQAEESDELLRSQKVEVVLEGRRASLLEGVWGTAWIGELTSLDCSEEELAELVWCRASERRRSKAHLDLSFLLQL